MTTQAFTSSLRALTPWVCAALALAASLWSWGWAAESHAWNARLADAWCGLAPHGATLEAGFLGHCAPCWAAAAALVAISLVAGALRQPTR